MPVQNARELKAALFEAYGGFADKRIKKLEHDAPFIVDDRGEGDYDARGQLFLWFCLIFAQVEAPDRVKLTLRGGVPENGAVEAWFDDFGAARGNQGIELTLKPDNIGDLVELEKRIGAIIKVRYKVPAYKYVVPRVVRSLKRLRKVLVAAWN